MRTTVLILSAAALVVPAVALQNTANGNVPVAGGVMNNKLGVTERATPDYNAAAPAQYSPPESASPSPASESNVHKRQATPGVPVPVPTPAGVPPSHVIPTPPVQPPVQPPVNTLTTTTSTTTTVSSATATATHTAFRVAHPVVNHAVEPHHANIGRRALDAGHDVVKRARDLLAASPAGVKREILVAIREALSDLDKLGLTGASGPQNDALAAEKHASSSHEDETVNMRGVDFTHNLDPLSTDDESVPEEQEAEPTYSSDV